MQTLALLRSNPDFARLWLAQVISLTGDWFNTIVLSALVVRYSPENQGLAISLLLLARFIPPMIFSPLAGVLIDNFDRKALLIWSNFLRAIVVIGFLFTLDDRPDLLWLIYLLTVLQFILSSVFEPGQAALIPTLVKREDLVQANTLVSVTWSVMLALGAILGGVVATLFGPQVALVIDALTFIAGGALIWMIRDYRYTPRPKRQAHEPVEETGLIDGLRFLRRHPEIASTLMVKAGGSIGNVDALMTIFATQIFVMGQDGQLSLGIMYSAFGIGAILGPVLLNRINDGGVMRMRRLVIIGFVLAALGWVVMGLAGSLLVLCLGLLIRAMGGSANWTYSTIIIQKTTPDAYLGRVFSIDMMGFYLATVISTPVHGALIDLVGSQNISWVALGTTLAALIPLMLWGWMVRWLQSRPQFQPVEPLPDPETASATG